MTALYLILLVIAAVLFALAALGVAAGRLNLIAAGLFFWVLVLVLQQSQKL